MYDCIVTGGLVVDGTGSAPRRADVAISDGRIAAIGGSGELGGAAAKRSIDAEGAIVTPGFVDVHTHYDGQATWDPELTPSLLHGVTTCVMGNCGIGFAPARKEHRERLIELMEGVEDIPGAALAEGLKWNWESFAEYMDALAKMPRSIDIATQVPHDALRVFIMGERGLNREAATDEDAKLMAACLREALVAGAVGFSTGRSDNHKSARGADTPAAFVEAKELAILGSAFQGLSHGVAQVVSDFDMNHGPEHFEREFGVVRALAEAAGGHRLSMSLMQRDKEPLQWKRILGEVEAGVAKGLPLYVQAGARAIGVLLGLDTTFHPFLGFPSYRAIADLPLEERLRRMQDPAFKAKLLQEKHHRVAGDNSIPPLVDELLERLEQISLRLFKLGEKMNYEPKLEDSVYAESYAKKMPVLEHLYDLLAAGETLYFPLYNYTEFSLDNVRTMLTHPRALFGLSDAGAHVGTVCDASFPTFMLSHWARDRKEGLPLEFVVHGLSKRNADYMGFRDRGELAVGKKADLNVIDMAKLRLLKPRLVHDLPAGGKRLLQDADGYRATLVSGTVVAEKGSPTGSRPGKVVRFA